MRRVFFKYVITTITILALVITVYSYAGNRNEEKKHSAQQYSVQNMGEEKSDKLKICIINLDTINPINSTNQNVQDIAKLIFEPLLNVKEDYKIELSLAREWAKLDDTNYIIKLKENVKWHNGKTVTSEDVKYTIEKIKENKDSVYYNNVVAISDILIIDVNTIKITLNQKVDFFEYQLTFPIICSSDNENEQSIGTGKYKIVEESDKKIVLQKHTEWWNEKELIINTIEVQLYDSISSAYQNFREGNIDLIITSNISIEDYIGSVGFYNKQFVNRQYDFIACNTDNVKLNQKEVRQALYYAINKEEIINQVYKGKYKTASWPLSYENNRFQEIEQNDYNIEIAKQKLRDANWQEINGEWKKNENGSMKTLKLKLTVCEDNEKRIQVAEIIKNQLELMGIAIDLQPISINEYNQCIESGKYELLLAGMQTSIAPDLNNYLGEGNLANFKNTEIENNLKEINSITEDTMLNQRYKIIWEILKEEQPYIGLYFETRTFAYQKNLKGNINPSAFQIFNDIHTWYVEK